MKAFKLKLGPAIARIGVAAVLALAAIGCGGVRPAAAPAVGPEARILRWEGVDNVRDLGGLTTKDGNVLKSGMIFRSQAFNDNAVSDWLTAERLAQKVNARYGGLALEFGAANAAEVLAQIDTNDLKASCARFAASLQKDKSRWRRGASRITEVSRQRILRETGLRTEIDLRTPSECWQMTGSPLGPEVKWVHVPGVPIGALPSPNGKKAFAKCFRLFLDEANYPIDFHCIAGADRTGALAFALEGILGVREKEMEEDYTLTSRSSSGPRTAKAFWKMAKAFDRYPGETLHAKVCAFARECGFTDEDFAAFRRIMLEAK